MPKMSKIFETETFILPISYGKEGQTAKKIRVRWKNKDGSTQSSPAIDMQDTDWLSQLEKQIEERDGLDTFRIESIDESGKQIGSETYKKKIKRPEQSVSVDIDAEPAPQQQTTNPQEHTMEPKNELQAQAVRDHMTATLLEKAVNQLTATNGKLMEHNTSLVTAILKDRSGEIVVDVAIKMTEKSEKYLERAVIAEAALAMETDKKKTEKTDPLKSAGDLFKTIKDGVKPTPELLAKEAIISLRDGKTETAISLLKEMKYEDVVKVLASVFIACAASLPQEKRETLQMDAMTEVTARIAASQKKG